MIPPPGPKYLRLKKFLANQTQSVQEIELGFGNLMGIVLDVLPKSAYLYRAWWANDRTHIQARAWLDAGWKVKVLRMEDRYVTFARRG